MEVAPRTVQECRGVVVHLLSQRGFRRRGSGLSGPVSSYRFRVPVGEDPFPEGSSLGGGGGASCLGYRRQPSPRDETLHKSLGRGHRSGHDPYYSHVLLLLWGRSRSPLYANFFRYQRCVLVSPVSTYTKVT